MESLCGDQLPFLNMGEIWSRPHMDLPLCFQETTMVWVPCFFFFLVLPYLVARIRRHRHRQHAVEDNVTRDSNLTLSTTTTTTNNDHNSHRTKNRDLGDAPNSEKDSPKDPTAMSRTRCQFPWVSTLQILLSALLVAINLGELIFCFFAHFKLVPHDQLKGSPSQQPPLQAYDHFRYNEHFRSQPSLFNEPQQPPETGKDSFQPFEFIAPSLKILIFSLALSVQYFHYRHRIASSVSLSLFWLLFGVQAALNSYSMSYHYGRKGELDAEEDQFFYYHNTGYVTIKLLGNCFIFLQLMLAAFFRDPIHSQSSPATAGAAPKTTQTRPDVNETVFGRLTFSWAGVIIYRSWRHALQYRDIWPLSWTNTATAIANKFIRMSSKPGDFRRRSVMRSILANYWPQLLYTTLLKLVMSVLPYTPSSMLALLLKFLKRCNGPDPEPAWHGALYVGVILVFSITDSLVNGYYEHKVETIAAQIRTFTTSLIYQKLFRLSGNMRAEFASAKIINHMINDAMRVSEFVFHVHDTWSAPLQVAVVTFMLWMQLQWSAFAGLGVMVLLIPVNIVIASKMRSIHTKLMDFKDQRVKLISEILFGIKGIKFNTWEGPLFHKLSGIRALELQQLRLRTVYKVILVFLHNSACFFMAATSFAVFIFMVRDNITWTFNAERAFVSLLLFNQLRPPLYAIPKFVNFFINVSLRRINSFMDNIEQSSDSVERVKSPEGDDIAMNNATFTWHLNTEDALLASFEASSSVRRFSATQLSSKPTLFNIQMSVRRGQLVGVVGSVGSGKSSLLEALMGNMVKLFGTIQINQSVGYVAQEPWIEHGTIRDNILFYNNEDMVRLQRVIDACGLKADIERMPTKEMTEVGENGVTLSRGQRQKIALARACYIDAELYLLDNPLSVFDSQMAKQIFKQVIGPHGLLRKKTRVIATQQQFMLKQCDYIYVLRNGAIAQSGTYAELEEQQVEFLQRRQDPNKKKLISSLMRTSSLSKFDLSRKRTESTDMYERHISVGNHPDEVAEDLIHEAFADLDLYLSSEAAAGTFAANEDVEVRDRAMSMKGSSIYTLSQLDVSNVELTPKPKAPSFSTMINDKSTKSTETRSPHLEYIQRSGPLAMVLVLFGFLANSTLNILSVQLLSIWSEENEHHNVSDTRYKLFNPFQQLRFDNASTDMFGLFNLEEENRNDVKYLIIFIVLGLGECLAMLVGTTMLSVSTLRVSQQLHQEMINKLLHAPLSYFETNSLGSILSRFSRDLDICDISLDINFRFFLNQVLRIIAIVLIIGLEAPYLLLVLLVALILIGLLQRLYSNTSQQLKVWESITKLQILSHFSATLAGASTIQAFNKIQEYVDQAHKYLDQHNIFSYGTIVINRWLAIRLEFLGYLSIFANALYILLGHFYGLLNNVSSAGLTLSYAMTITRSLRNMIKAINSVEVSIISVRRCFEMANLPQERENLFRVTDKMSHAGWPAAGVIEFVNYATSYAPKKQPPVLQEINFKIFNKEKVAIVGPNGAGKSTIALALYRLLEATEGRILIDGLDIAELNLLELRSRMSIIAQDPVLFTGTLRYNLDPFMDKDELDMWAILKRTKLDAFVQSFDNGLNFEIIEQGENLSVGQKQLISLARAVLHKTNILVLDEALAAADSEYDVLFREILEVEFSDCTIITITHQMSSIVDFGRVIVLDEGRVKEIGEPKMLLKNKHSALWAMVNEAGLGGKN